MSVLTEEMVLQRTKCKGLEFVRKLNICAARWTTAVVNETLGKSRGVGISDISIVRRMPLLEIASCSVNSISTLADFAHCPHLQELYIRKNNIQDLSEICHLKDLQNLNSLWLYDNPCSNENNYRSIVLKQLPRLQKLDNISVTKEELQQAVVCTDDLSSDNSEIHSSSTAELTSADMYFTSKDLQQTPESFSIPRSLENEGTAVSSSLLVKKAEKEVVSDKEDSENLTKTLEEKSPTDPRNSDQPNSNVVQALLLLMEELSYGELIIIKDCVNRRLSDMT